ncbi:MAG TPA: archaeosortase/exosortase family protein [Blastocatellia bacterium]|nr:archaeosortase/exosortase family protein [Blastocatellia bacterium]
MRLIKAEILLAVELLAFWPVWRWYVHRINDQSDEAWGVVALVTAVLFALWHRQESGSGIDKIVTLSSPQRRRERGGFAEGKREERGLILPAMLLVCYALSYHFISPLPRAVIAVTAIAATISAIRFGQRLHLGLWGLLLLALPVVASLQFYLGFPMRAVVAELAAPMLQLNGFAVVAEGACLNWNGDLILIDAPCSGVKMLWTGFFLTFTLACYYRLNAKRTALACVGAFSAIIIGNTFRAAALFYVEAGAANLSLPNWTHEGVGVVIFLVTAVAIAWMARKIDRTENHQTET